MARAQKGKKAELGNILKPPPAAEKTAEAAGLIWKSELLQHSEQGPPTKRWKR